MNRIASIMAMATVEAAAPSNNLLANLMSYWKLDEASGTRNDSHGSNHLTDNNTVVGTGGILGNCAEFTKAASEYLSCTSNSTLQMSGNTDFTISFWIQLKFVTNQSLVTKDDDAANSRDYTIDYVSGSGLRFYIKGGGTYMVTSAGTGSVGLWYFIVCWYDSSNGQLHLRLNDSVTYDSSGTGATGTDASSAQFRIGAREYAANEDYADSFIDEVGLWKRLLTGPEITTLYNSGSGFPYSSFDSGGGSTLPTGLRAYYKLEGLTESVSGLTLTNNGTVTFGTGKVNSAANFVAASTQYLTRADNAAFQMGTSTDFTLAFWTKYTSSAADMGFVVYGYNGGVQWGFRSVGGGNIRLIVYDGSTLLDLISTSTFNDGAWHLAVATASRTGNLSLYVDNASQATPTSMTSLGSVNNTDGFGIGICGAGTLTGSVDEVGVWNRVLSGGEMTELWNGGSGTTYPF